MNGSLPPANSWSPAAPCDTPSDSPSIVNGITITGTPATIVAVSSGFSVWSITLNDGGAPPNFTIDHYDSAGNLIDHPIEVSGVDGSITFNDPVYLSRDPLAPLEAATKEYVDASSLIGQDVPQGMGICGRENLSGNGAWTPLAPPALPYLPLAGGFVTGGITLQSANGGVRYVAGQTAAQAYRWAIYYGDATVETGGNSGSNFVLTGFTDAGAGVPQLTIDRNGNWTVPGQVNVTGAISLASPGNLKIGGGNSGDALMSDGAGNVLWGAGGSGGGITDAPIDGNQYGRQNANWTLVPSQVISADAPGTTVPYGRITGAWQALGQMATQADAIASPGVFFVRSNGGWINLNQTNMFLPLAGGTLTGALTISGAGSILNVSSAPIYLSAAPNNRVIAGFNAAGTQPRWAMYYGDATTESGGNAGSNFSLSRYSDTGVIIDTPLSVSRASGLVSMPDGATVPTAAPGDNSSLTANTAWVNAAIAAIPPPPQPTPPIGENRIINGNFAINQRGYTSGAGISAAAYGHDRWKAGAAGCSYTFTAALPDTTITITAGSLTQVIEAGVIEGGVYTLSWTGTAQARVYQGAPTGAYASSPVVTTALAVGVNTIIEFNIGTVVRVKFEIGSVATPFNRPSLTKSTADCQRYYQVGVFNGSGNLAANGWWGWSWALPVQMRANPTVGVNATTATNVANVSMAGVAGSSVYISATAIAAGNVALQGNYNASAEL